jgi:hypothetical protein
MVDTIVPLSSLLPMARGSFPKPNNIFQGLRSPWEKQKLVEFPEGELLQMADSISNVNEGIR